MQAVIEAAVGGCYSGANSSSFPIPPNGSREGTRAVFFSNPRKGSILRDCQLRFRRLLRPESPDPVPDPVPASAPRLLPTVELPPQTH